MNQVGSDRVQWHLEQAALQDLIAAREEKHGFYWEAEQHHDKAQWHRNQAAALDREKKPA